MKIAVCGSMSFSTEMMEVAERLRKLGHVVEVPAFTQHYVTLESRDEMHADAAQNKVKHNLIKYNYEMVERNDVVLVLNKTKRGIENYIGSNTLIEMAFAYILGKKIYLMNPVPTQDSKDEIVAMQPRVINGKLEEIV